MQTTSTPACYNKTTDEATCDCCPADWDCECSHERRITSAGCKPCGYYWDNY